MAVNLVTLGMFYSLAVFAYVPTATRAVDPSPHRVTFLASPMPAHRGRAAGRRRLHLAEPRPRRIPGTSRRVVGGVGFYLVRTRWLGDPRLVPASSASSSAGSSAGSTAGIGFVLAATGWWFISRCGRRSTARSSTSSSSSRWPRLSSRPTGLSFFASNNGILFVSIVTIILTSARSRWAWPATLGSRSGACILGSSARIMFVLMLVSSQADFKTLRPGANENLFGLSGAYDKDARRRGRQRRLGADLAPTIWARNLATPWPATLAMIPFMLFWILYPNWGSTLYGEVRGSGDFRKVLRGMLGGIWVTAGLALAFVLLAARRSAGTSSPRPTRTSSTTSTGTRRRRRRCRSGATRRSSRRT
jgi:hypothetical protein